MSLKDSSKIRKVADRLANLNLGSKEDRLEGSSSEQKRLANMPQDNVQTTANAGSEEHFVPEITSDWIDKLVFLGTGTSGQVPAIHCITQDPDDKDFEIPCAACADAVRLGDESKNRRMCTGAVVVGSDKGKPTEEERLRSQLTILIDCGPTFYSSAIRVFPKHQLRRIDACLLTHAHADAILGLDHLRAWTLGGVVQPYVDVYLTQETMNTVEKMFPYLVDRTKATGGGGVGALRWHTITSSKSFTVKRGSSQVQVTPLPVLHGFVDRTKPFEFIGFRIKELSYISDCHYVPESTSKLVEGSKVLVIDALKWRRHASHFSVAQALQYCLSIKSLQLALLTDLTHELEHSELSSQLETWQRGMRQIADVVKRRDVDRDSWWRGFWDENASERFGVLELSKPPPSQEDNPIPAISPINVPTFRVAYDRQTIRFKSR